jgi:hypothetical protein
MNRRAERLRVLLLGLLALVLLPSPGAEARDLSNSGLAGVGVQGAYLILAAAPGIGLSWRTGPLFDGPARLGVDGAVFLGGDSAFPVIRPSVEVLLAQEDDSETALGLGFVFANGLPGLSLDMSKRVKTGSGAVFEAGVGLGGLLLPAINMGDDSDNHDDGSWILPVFNLHFALLGLY